MTGRVKGILFDLGDTLIDFAHVSMTAMFRQGARGGYEYLQELGKSVPGFRKFHYRQLWAIRWNYIKARVTGREFNSLDVMRHFARKWGYELSEPEYLELAWRFYKPLSKAATIVPGAPETLATLAEKGLKLAVVSNTFLPGSVLDRHLEIVSLSDLIETRIYSSEVGYRKPSPKIFQLALEQSGLHACDALFVGDSPKADIFGARRAGMVTVLRDRSKKRSKKMRTAPDHRIADMTELLQIVAQYEGPEGE
ncbi:MAG: HAD family hydrolase [Phycisphaerae bacterium]|jgi:HAD superfamily hydrolase (TIGR01549 family)|nr:HAD family hydrolase [Phycisphaerae bacterium]